MFLRCVVLCCLAALVACGSNPPAPTPSAAPTADRAPSELPTKPISANTLYDLLVAEVAANRNDFPVALRNYKRQAFATRDLQVTARATHLAQYLGALDDAEELSLLWIELAPEDPEAHFVYAATLSRQGQLALAFSHMETVRDLGGNTAYSSIAAESLRQSPAEQAALLAAIDDALKERPDDVELLLSRSIVQQQTDKAGALATVRTARKLAPDDAQALIMEATLLQQLDNSTDALRLLEAGVEQHPQHTRMRLLYARVLTTNSEFGPAREQFEYLLDMAPGDPDTLFSLGLISRELEDYSASREYFERLLDTGVRQSEAHFYLGTLDLQSGADAASLEHFKQVEPGRDFLPAMTQVAKQMLDAGKGPALTAFFTQQRARYPQVAVQLYILESDILIHAGDLTAAGALLDRANDEFGDSADLLYARSLLAEKRGDIKGAERDLRRIISIDPDNGAALNALGYVLTNHSKRYLEAQGLIRRALVLSPNDPTVLDSMGWVKFRMGDTQAALGYLEQAYERYPDPEIAAHLGEVLWTLGRRERAIAIWREGLNKDAAHGVLRETVRRLGADEQVGATP